MFYLSANGLVPVAPCNHAVSRDGCSFIASQLPTETNDCPFAESIEDQPREGTTILNMVKEPYFRIRQETETID